LKSSSGMSVMFLHGVACKLAAGYSISHRSLFRKHLLESFINIGNRPHSKVKTRHYPAFSDNGNACFTGVVGEEVLCRVNTMIRCSACRAIIIRYTMRDFSCK
jgi:hypothetical protein